MTNDVAREIGENYSFEEIQRHLKADLKAPWFIIRRDGQILGLRLHSPINSEVDDVFRCVFNSNPSEAEVWIGTDSSVVEWGTKLFQCENPLHLYFSSRPDKTYNYQGLFTVLPRQSTSSELTEAAYLWQLKRPISKIIYLEKHYD